MTACCVSGYRPLRDIRLDECRWPPVLAPAGPWEICDCAEGDEVRRVRSSRTVTIRTTANLGKTEVAPDIVACSTCADPDPGTVIEWNDRWRTWLCPECGSVLAEEEETR